MELVIIIIDLQSIYLSLQLHDFVIVVLLLRLHDLLAYDAVYFDYCYKSAKLHGVTSQKTIILFYLRTVVVEPVSFM
jgi:hypothetical protein